MSLPLTDRALADGQYPNLFNGLDILNVTGPWDLTGIYSNGSSLYLSSDLFDQSSNSFEGLFDGSGALNVASGQVQAELDVYFLNGGYGGISTTGQIVATAGLQVLSGTSSFDGGTFTTDGGGNIFATGAVAGSFTGDVINCTIYGFPLSSIFYTDGSVGFSQYASFGANSEDTILVNLSGRVASDDGTYVGVEWANIYNTPTDLYGYGITDTVPLAYDSGWTANADAGDKTVVIGSTASLTTIATALNLVSSGAGTALLNIAQKVKAIEAALATSLIPSA